MALRSRSRRVQRAGLAVAAVVASAASLAVAVPGAAATVTQACSVSAPLTDILLRPQPPADFARQPYVAFSAVNSHGTYGGVAADANGTFELIRYDLPLHRVIVLDKMRLNPWDDPRSVTAVGVDNSGAITYKVVQFGGTSATYMGYRYAGGHKYVLWHLPTWSNVEPESVAADGAIVGEVKTGATMRVVEWTGTGTGRGWYLAGPNTSEATFDGRGNVGYVQDSVGFWLRSPSGAVRELVGPDGETMNSSIWTAGSGYWIYGSVTDTDNRPLGVRWRTADATGTGPLIGALTSPIAFANASGPDGTIVGVPAMSSVQIGQEYYLKPGIPVHHMPALLRVDKYSLNLPVTVNPNGSVVFTGPDGRPRIVNCVA